MSFLRVGSEYEHAIGMTLFVAVFLPLVGDTGCSESD
jgi:hypothetical protein